MIEEQLTKRTGLRLRLAKEGIYVGFIAGALIVLFRYILTLAEKYIVSFFRQADESILYFILMLGILGVAAFLSALLLKYEPMISGSGIPQVQGEIKGHFTQNWFSVLLGKITGGFLSLGMGLTAGREGPSVQIGAASAKMYASLTKRPLLDHNFLLSAGASAGLAAAFNAPLAGIVFALEEAHRNFSILALLPAMTAAIVSDFIAKTVFGLAPVLHFEGVISLSLQQYYFLIPLGIIMGLAGFIFNKGIVLTKKIYDNLKIDLKYKMLIPFVLTGIICTLFPLLWGSGHDLINLSQNGDTNLLNLAILLTLKFFLLLITFGSGLAGGIFFPLLVLGALVGQIYMLALNNLQILDEKYLVFMVILAMAAHFTAVVRAPLTGILLLSEMTGSFAYFLPLAIVSAIAYVTSELLHNEPIYETLLEILVAKQNNEQKKTESFKQAFTEIGGATYSQTRLFEVPVITGSQAAGKKIKEIVWPAELLLVAVKRGALELLPRGDTYLQVGDYLVAMSNEDNLAEKQRLIHNLCSEVASGN